MDKITYRKLKQKESKDYRFIRLESLEKYPSSYGSTAEKEKQKAKLAFENYIETSDPENFIVGAILQETLIAICGFHRLKGDRKHRGEIIQMYVQPKHQGKQIGFNLLEATITEAFKIRALEQIELQVISDLKPANKIYEKIGFQECGLQKRFYKKHEKYFDLRLMVLYRISDILYSA